MKIVGEVPVVIGANFGDEGKGLMTDFLVRQALDRITPNSGVLCIRHNGGPQAGHTIQIGDDRYISNSIPTGCIAGPDVVGLIGCNSFINPKALCNEIHRFKATWGFLPSLLISGLAKVITPWDVMLNQILETGRGEKRHGSCGHGIGSCYQRSLHGLVDQKGTWFDFLDDLAYDRTRILDNTKQYGLTQLAKSGYPFNINQAMSEAMIEGFRNSIKELVALIDESAQYRKKDHFSAVIEGAQGLGLGMRYFGQDPWFFNVTPSDPGLDSAISTLDQWIQEDVTFRPVYVTRTYLTRHGAGPLYSEKAVDVGPVTLPYGFPNPDLTNVPNQWQGSLRCNVLDVTDMYERIKDDLFIPWKPRIVKPSLAVTWTDAFEFKDSVRSLPVRYIANGPTRNHITEYSNVGN